MSSDQQPNNQALNIVLRQKRQEQKMTLAQVAERLKLTEAKIDQLEQADQVETLNPFDRGHLRNYAALLEVDMTPYELDVKQARLLACDLKSIQKRENLFMPLASSKYLLSALGVMLLVVVVYFVVTGLMNLANTQTVEAPVLGGIMLEKNTDVE